MLQLLRMVIDKSLPKVCHAGASCSPLKRGHKQLLKFYQRYSSRISNALTWYITKDETHWNRSTTILDAWGTTLTDIVGTDTSLLVGLEGTMFANAAEIMRWEGNWTEAGAE